MKRTNPGNPNTKMLDVSMPELLAVVEQAKGALSADDHQKLAAAISTLGFLMEEIRNKSASIGRLKQMLFGASTEKTGHVFGEAKKNLTGSATGKKEGDEKAPGHGRRSAAAYTGAEKKQVKHPALQHGDCCPGCVNGKVYSLRIPKTLVRVTGMAPIGATVWELERVRCSTCGEVYKAEAPEEVGDRKYDETVSSMVALLRYGNGLPFNRIEKLQKGFGIPLPASTQWDLAKKASGKILAAHEELIRQAAQGAVVHNVDTKAKILELNAEQRQAAAADDASEERTGVFTSGIVSKRNGKEIVLFFTGPKHAGENLADLLSQRAHELPPPIQMCDALAANTAGVFESVLANCTSHARREFVEIFDNFPVECRRVLETYREVYRHEATAKKANLSDEERLRFHQENSGPLMEDLEKWIDEQFDEHKVEPNSGIGKALAYLKKHWPKLTLFLHKAGAPLDNNVCERALKKSIMHRKNSLFYKTLNGARVGDIFMSLIYTAEANGENPFDYIVALQRHELELLKNPADWMPWNFRQSVARLAAESLSPCAV
jgi:hypothetical protein